VNRPDLRPLVGVTPNAVDSVGVFGRSALTLSRCPAIVRAMATRFYRIGLIGAAMEGAGVLVFQKAAGADRGVIVGADAGGLFYDGEFREEQGELVVNMRVRVPQGAVLVTGAPAAPAAYSLEFEEIRRAPEDMTMPITVQMPSVRGGGSVQVQLKELRVDP
jgi:hypothetical protein